MKSELKFTMNKTELQSFVENLMCHGPDYFDELREENKSDSELLKSHIINVMDSEGIYLEKDDITVTIHD
ncbi:hypothetical protein [Xenorhabdus hominickii]|uniref:Uncharacterized protein n=1 Tax=Xenorhabdus hominickii TaxID=351679 RepID=A0A2G0Q603_XENHO|nr:hypothetical protein [Xenorhabdus hominickii]AOM39595.1 hypothetical protein A9255_02685 [Xenorhabdus hominickii]PHM54631.1 hypothetical protein Xhom_02577 [Xenorhabdus hominickii]